MSEITISVEEYKRLLEAQVRIRVFSEFVNREAYSIDRAKCAGFLGFELEKADEG